MIKIPVHASRDYDVVMNPGILQHSGFYIKESLGLKDDPLTGKLEGKKICIVTDATVNQLYAQPDQTLFLSLRAAGFEVYKFVFQGGEETKSMETIEQILDFLTSKNFTRTDLLLAFGGGIVGDVTGFAAATYLRGVEFIQVPTTLLACVDSSVGGKTGVNLRAGKNLAGAFWQPSLVLFDPNVLETLSYDLKLDGIAEAIKAGMIADKLILEAIQKKRTIDDPEFLTTLAAMAVEVKRQVVEEDERDHGSRQLLNFGHTIAHGIEKCSNYRISHGHAVAIGMKIVAIASDRLGWTIEKCSEDLIEILERFGFPLECPFSAWELADVALSDKKRRGDNITLVIPVTMGKCRLKTIPVSKLEQFIAYGVK
ncbi:MAG: 3-dehydroquinate synthase [Eubacterium sp.]|nr:3-dehydroquinate synthase [Candidatus Colimonas fimequi]